MSKKERLTDEELLAQFEGIDDKSAIPSPGKTGVAPPPQQSEADLLEELGIPERPKSSNRTHTPGLSSTSGTRGSSKQSVSMTPPGTSDGTRSSDEKTRMRKSGESTRSFHNSFTPASTGEAEPVDAQVEQISAAEVETEASTGGGSWWSAITSTASAAVKQAEALAREIQRNEEAQRWAEQVKGNVGNLRNMGDELRSRALPTFTNLLHTLAPPISSHERLQIHITHDIVGYPSLDPIVYSTFSRVMAQVEGGDLMVIQRGQESSQKRDTDPGYTGASNGGWSDGPWWRQAARARNLGTVKGIVAGTKLSRVSAESYANDYFSARGGVEAAIKSATEVLSETNPTRSSDIFLAIQAISQNTSSELFGAAASTQKPSSGSEDSQETAQEADEFVCFAIFLHDPVHGITLATTSQSLPEKWIQWLDASASPDEVTSELPEEIADIVNGGGVDPREWVAEWLEETITLAVGIVAQRYVARRMGVGQGGLGVSRPAAVESGGGEAARAV